MKNKIIKTIYTLAVRLPSGDQPCIRTNSEFRVRAFAALEVANDELGRAAKTTEIAAYFDRALPAGGSDFAAAPGGSRKIKIDRFSQALQLFVRHKLAVSEKVGKNRFYISSNKIEAVANSKVAAQFEPLRCSVLGLTAGAVKACGSRPVRTADVREYARQHQITHVTDRQIVNNMWSLCRTGELKLAGKIKGDGGGGTLFLPTAGENPNIIIPVPAMETATAALSPTDDLTLANLVITTITKLWRQRSLQSVTQAKLPQPFSTKEIHTAVKAAAGSCRFETSAPQISMVLRNLACAQKPALRRFKQKNKSYLWLPAHVLPEHTALADAYTSDAARAAEAVARAFAKFGSNRPVALHHIRAEIKADPHLATTGKMSLSVHLNSLNARPNFKKNPKLSGFNFTAYVISAGSVNQTAYYLPAKANIEQARAWVEFYKVEQDYKKLNRRESTASLRKCQLAAVAQARAIQFYRQLENLLARLNAVAGQINDVEIETLTNIIQQDQESILNLRHELKSRLGSGYTAQAGTIQLQGLTARELIELLAPFDALAAEVKENATKHIANKIGGRLNGRFWRIPNPAYLRKQNQNERAAAEYLYERTDVLINVGLRYGGDECRFQAAAAKNELGTLRDPAPLLDALLSPDYEERLTAVCCLAFLQTGTVQLRRAAETDGTPEVRAAALWAAAFVDENNYREFAAARASGDTTQTVRSLADAIATAGTRLDIWRL